MKNLKEGDKLPGLCCPGFDAEILCIISKDCLYYACENPDCPDSAVEEYEKHHGVHSDITNEVCAWQASGMALPFEEWRNTPEAIIP